jgi:outer membrane protein assembly factor BamE (lipoprotein component of BamABCDE complex)
VPRNPAAAPRVKPHKLPHMNTSKLLMVAAALGTACLTGCSTVSSRIQENPGLFASLPPDQQALVQQGKVSIGMDMATVRLAKGDPDHVTTRTNAGGQMQVWHYVNYEDDNGIILYSGYYHRWWGLNGWGPGYPYYLDYPARRPHDYFRVEFGSDNRVREVQEETRSY